MAYAFQAEPRALQATPPSYNGSRTLTSTQSGTGGRTIYRAGNTTATPKVKANLMNDKRIVRGSTYAPRGVVQPVAVPLAQTLPRQPAQRSGSSKQKRGGGTRDMTASAIAVAPMDIPRPVTPEAVAGRHHMITQTMDYREDLSKKKVLLESFTQTDAEKDYPTAPLFDPKSSGDDVATSIETGALFDFEMEVEPVLHVLVTKVLEQGLMEVCEEEELKALAAHRREFGQDRDVRHTDVQRMAAKDERRVQESQRRHAQALERVARENEVKSKQAAATMAHQLMLAKEEKTREEAARHAIEFEPLVLQVRDQYVPEIKNTTSSLLDEVSIAEQAFASLMDDAKTKHRSVVADARERSFAKAYYQPGDEKGEWSDAKYQSDATERRRIGVTPLTAHSLAATTYGAAEHEYDRTRIERIRNAIRDDLRRANELMTLHTSTRGHGTDTTAVKATVVTEELRRTHEKPTQTLARLKGSLGVRCIPLPTHVPKPRHNDDDEEEERPVGGAQIAFVDPLMGAAQATLIVGDIITAIGEETISSPQDISNIVSDIPIGDVVEVEVRRALSGAVERIPVEIAGSWPLSYHMEEVRKLRIAAELPVSDTELMDASMALTRLRRMHAKLGAKIVDPPQIKGAAAVAAVTAATDAAAATSTSSKAPSGVRLNKIVIGGAAHRGGIRDDDKVMLVDGMVMTTEDEFALALEGHTPGDYLTVHILRKEKWWKPPVKKEKKVRSEDDDDEDDEEEEEEEEEKVEEPEDDDDEDEDDDDDNAARSKKKVVVGPSSAKKGGAPAKSILKGKAAATATATATAATSRPDTKDGSDTPRSNDPLISGPMSVRWRRHGLEKAPLSASEIDEEAKRGEWEVVYIELGARGTKNTLELIRSLRLIGGLTVAGDTVDTVKRRMIDPNQEAKDKQRVAAAVATATATVAATPATTTPTSVPPSTPPQPSAVPRIAASNEKSIVGEVAAGLIPGMTGRRLRSEDEHDAASLLRSLRPSIGFTYVPSITGNGVDVDTLHPQAGAVQIHLTYGDRITMVGDRDIKSVEDMIIAERELTPGDVVSINVVRALGNRDERLHLEIGAQHRWVLLSDIREWRRIAGRHVSSSSLIDKSLAITTLKLMPPRLAAKIADATPTAQVLVTGVEEGGAADRAGLLANDIIMTINGTRVTTTADVAQLITSSNIIAGDEIILGIRRPNTIPILSVALIVAASPPLPPPLGDDGEPLDDLTDDSEIKASSYRLAGQWRREEEMVELVRSLRTIAALRVTYL